MRIQKISGKVVKRGRKWLKIAQNGHNEKYPENLLINALTENLKVGDRFEGIIVETVRELQYKGGFKITHTAIEETVIQQEIERWWGYVKKAYENNKIYSNGISKLHELGCYDYDKEIVAMKEEISMSKQTKKLKIYKGFTIEKSWIKGVGEETFTASSKKNGITLESDSLKTIKRQIDELVS